MISEELIVSDCYYEKIYKIIIYNISLPEASILELALKPIMFPDELCCEYSNSKLIYCSEKDYFQYDITMLQRFIFEKLGRFVEGYVYIKNFEPSDEQYDFSREVYEPQLALRRVERMTS